MMGALIAGYANTLAVPFDVTVDAPSSLDLTGGSDTTAALNDWISGLPSGAMAQFPLGSTLRIDHPVKILGKSRIILNGKGVTFTTADPTGDGSPLSAPSKAARTRSHFAMQGCYGSMLYGVKFIGPNPSATYNSALEAQHFIDMAPGSTPNLDCSIWQADASNIYGDFVYIGNNSADTEVADSHFKINGRQGASITSGRRSRILRNSFDQIARTCLDLEPNPYGVVDGVWYEGNLIGYHRLNFISAASGYGWVRNVMIRLNQGGALGTANSTIGNTNNPNRQSNWSLERNHFTHTWGAPTGARCLSFHHVDGVRAVYNDFPLQAGRGDYAIGLDQCTTPDGQAFVPQAVPYDPTDPVAAAKEAARAALVATYIHDNSHLNGQELVISAPTP